MEAPTYLVKSRSGDTLIHGSAEQVMLWVKERRVSDKDELKRLGWVIYEKDEAWAVISAFPELSGPSAHAAVQKIRRQNFWILASALLLGVIGFSLISLSLLLPAYDASQRIEASEEAQRQAIVAKQKAEAEAKTSAGQAALAKQDARQAEANLDEQVRRTALVQAEAGKLAARLEQIKATMPVLVRWNESLLNNDKCVVITNTSDKSIKLLVSIYDAKGLQTKKQFPLTLGPAGLTGSTKESGVWEAVKHYFKKGEGVELTDVDTAKDDRFTRVRVTCP
jgi:hypothetical protein